MATVRKSRGGRAVIPATIWIFILLFVIVVFWAVLPDNDDAATTDNAAVGAKLHGLNNNKKNSASSWNKKLRRAVQTKRDALTHALAGLTSSNLPSRLQVLRDQHAVIGERLLDIQQGRETAQEILLEAQHHGGKGALVQDLEQVLQHLKRVEGHVNVADELKRLKREQRQKAQSLAQLEAEEVNSDKPPLLVSEIVEYLNEWIHKLHETLKQAKHATFEGIWQAYHDYVVKTLYVWDQEYLQRMPPRRDDGSIFLSLASYRDEHCFDTLYQAYHQAKHPDQLFVGLVQQNCHENCKSGVLGNLSMVPVEPDADCHAQFCSSDLGQSHCHQVRLIDVNESESLGPYFARYMASKLWNGESWYMQTDAHMTFLQDWDAISVQMLNDAPSHKPVLSHYPPGHDVDLSKHQTKPGGRLCGPVFANSDLENQIIRLEGGSVWDEAQLTTPAFAPFTAAGYFVSHSHMLQEVPFDPFLPWIFMGEEIIMSSRLWTAGYDIFSPTISVVGHWYVRRHKPKFWESVHRAFTFGVHNPLQMMILDRIKYQLGYPEAALDMLPQRSILTAVESYTMGRVRPLKRYLQLIGVNMTTKVVEHTEWCEKGYPPPGFEQFDHLYPQGVAKRTKKWTNLATEDNGENEQEDDDWLPREEDGGGEDDEVGADDDTESEWNKQRQAALAAEGENEEGEDEEDEEDGDDAVDEEEGAGEDDQAR